MATIQSITQVMMQAAIEAAKSASMAIIGADNLVNNTATDDDMMTETIRQLTPTKRTNEVMSEQVLA